MGSEDNVDINIDTRVTRTQQLVTRNTSGTECMVAIYGINLGQKFDMQGNVLTIGRDSETNTIVLESDSVSRQHARIVLDDGTRYIEDLDSTNGTYVDDILIEQLTALSNGALLRIGDTIFKYLKADHVEAAYFDEIFRMTVVDGLTQIANKRALDTFLYKEMSRTRRYDRTLTIVMMDIDRFKSVNDSFGHLVGDMVLKELTTTIQAKIRKEELFARYGGEEFVFVLPETEIEGAGVFAERIRKMVEEMSVEYVDESIHITVSMGIARYDLKAHKEPNDLIGAADEKMYSAKKAGRNRVCG